MTAALDDALTAIERCRDHVFAAHEAPGIDGRTAELLKRAHVLAGGALGDVRENMWDRARAAIESPLDGLEARVDKLPIEAAGHVKTVIAALTIAARAIDVACLESAG